MVSLDILPSQHLSVFIKPCAPGHFIYGGSMIEVLRYRLMISLTKVTDLIPSSLSLPYAHSLSSHGCNYSEVQ